jgi:site-specific DNA-methyltransferase (adenine-specific)
MLLHGDCRGVMEFSIVSGSIDCIIADPPYADTSLAWDSLVDGWLPLAADVLKPSGSLWVFGSMRFLAGVFADVARLGFKYSQDIVWEKQNGTGFHNDRFRRVHEHAVLFYRGQWRNVYHEAQFTNDARKKVVRRKTRPTHTGYIERGHYVSEDGGPRLMRSVLQVRNEHGRAIHPTQKPLDLLRPMVRYSVPPGGLMLEPFGGSGSATVAAVLESRDAVYVESDADASRAGSARIQGVLSQ